MHQLVLSTLPQTWLIDIDGTIFTHNGYLEGADQLIESALAINFERDRFPFIDVCRDETI